MHAMTRSGARCALTQYEMIPVKGENTRESILGDSRFRTDEWEGESCVFAMLGMYGGRTESVFGFVSSFWQLPCTKYFHPSYRLIYVNFQRFKHFLNLF